MNTQLLLVLFFISIFNTTIYLRYYPPLKKIDHNREYYTNILKGIVPYEKIKKEQYNIEIINCGNNDTYDCVRNKYDYFFDSNDKLKKKTLIYFTNDVLTFDITTSDWYKNGDNIIELKNKTNMLYLLPQSNLELGDFMFMTDKKNAPAGSDRAESFIYDYINKYKIR